MKEKSNSKNNNLTGTKSTNVSGGNEMNAKA